jgi:hypothetical protein
VLRWAENEPQDSAEKTGVPARKERHYQGLESAFALLGIPPRRLKCQCGASVVTAPGAVITKRRILMKLDGTRSPAMVRRGSHHRDLASNGWATMS